MNPNGEIKKLQNKKNTLIKELHKINNERKTKKPLYIVKNAIKQKIKKIDKEIKYEYIRINKRRLRNENLMQINEPNNFVDLFTEPEEIYEINLQNNYVTHFSPKYNWFDPIDVIINNSLDIKTKILHGKKILNCNEVRAYLTVTVRFESQIHEEAIPELIDRYFHLPIDIFLTDDSIRYFNERLWARNLELAIQDYINEARSGLTLINIPNIQITVLRYTSVRGGHNNVKFPFTNHAVLNIQNNDEFCILYCLAASDFRPTDHPERASKYDISKFNKGDLSFPLAVEDIKKLEKLNTSYSINLYKMKDKTPYLDYESKHLLRKKVNLVLVQNHYMLITNINAFLKWMFNDYEGNRCPRCFIYRRDKESLNKHLELCLENKPLKIKFPKLEDANYCFKAYNKQQKHPYVIYADLETIGNNHEPIGLEYYHTYYNEYRILKGSNCIEKFIDNLLIMVNDYHELITHFAQPNYTEDDIISFHKAKICWICLKPFIKNSMDYKVKDHDHFSGKYRGSAHNSCNLKFKVPNDIPILFHCGAKYDFHFIIKVLSEKCKNQNFFIIPKSGETFITIQAEFQFSNWHDKIRLKFIDSYKFLSANLDCLGKTLNFSKLPWCYDIKPDRLRDSIWPDKIEFFNKIKNTNIDDEEYNIGKQLFTDKKCKTLEDYFLNIYLHRDVEILTNVFENFRNKCLIEDNLDPVHYLSLNGYAEDACLKISPVNVKLLHVELPYVDEINLMMKIRGGLAQLGYKRYAESNENSTIVLLDFCNMYGNAMKGKLPYEIINYWNSNFPEDLLNRRCFIEVDLEYPYNKEHNDLPLCPHHINGYLRADFYDKEKVVMHIDELKLWIELGMKIKKIHRACEFLESEWIKPWIEKCFNKRMEAKKNGNKLHDIMYKLLINSVFGKTLENQSKYKDIKIVNTPKKALHYNGKSDLEHIDVISENLSMYHFKKTDYYQKKPNYVGLAILSLARTHYYATYYKIIKNIMEKKLDIFMVILIVMS